jgi:hypothetical protein
MNFTVLTYKYSEIETITKRGFFWKFVPLYKEEK